MAEPDSYVTHFLKGPLWDGEDAYHVRVYVIHPSSVSLAPDLVGSIP